ncbi:MAG: exosortase system-associated protein, TIGR04073 family [Candidatus Omnitrophica bacterium]|nr:exosortase system-associated protein, TIGR04073 family [Candidatus Omnitrophota bacterium]
MSYSKAPPAFEKLGRGIANTTGGCLEIPLTMHRQYSDRDTGGSLATGAGFGLVKGVVRTVVGVYEIATFWLPFPEHFAPILPTLGYYDLVGETRRPLPLE